MPVTARPHVRLLCVPWGRARDAVTGNEASLPSTAIALLIFLQSQDESVLTWPDHKLGCISGSQLFGELDVAGFPSTFALAVQSRSRLSS
jgi:hypothetical protein